MSNSTVAIHCAGGLRVAKTDTWTSAHNYTWGPGGVLCDSNNSSAYAPGLGQRQGGNDRFLHSDWLGSSRYLSDSSGNSFPSQLRCDAFGGRSATGGTDGSSPSPFEFAGDFGYQTEYASSAEPGLGLQYLQDRYYDPASGRFITQDPLGVAGGVNRYGYVGNDPVNGADPSGDNPVVLAAGFAITGTIGAQAASNDYLATHVNDYNGAAHFWATTKGFFGAFNPLNLAHSLVAAADNFGRLTGCYDGGYATGLDVTLAGADAGVQVVGAALTIYGGVKGIGQGVTWLLERTPCFVAGTPVAMADGSTKPIEQVKVGDVVFSRDEGTGQTAAKRVQRVSERETQGTVVLTFADGEQLETTEGHPFAVEGKGFVAAGQLAMGTSIVTRAGPAVKLAKVERHSETKRVYNFEVEDFHTYFVGKADGGLWVHNQCSKPWWKAHVEFGNWIRQQNPGVQFDVPRPNGPGPDAVVVNAQDIDVVGFGYAEVKPIYNEELQKGLDQIVKRRYVEGYPGPGRLYSYRRSGGKWIFDLVHEIE